jgi:hypothetical protein
MSTATAFTFDSPAADFALTAEVSVAPMQLTDKYRPKYLADIKGQGAVVDRFDTFLSAPYSRVFIFAGDCGIGKTSLAKALANELGCESDMIGGGFEVIESGEQNGDRVDQSIRDIHLRPMFGSGWRVLVVEEADYGSAKAAHLWLTTLENLPGKRVVIFTTNHVDKFPQRFIERAERIDFESRAEVIMQDVQTAVNEVWQGETGRSDAPDVYALRGLVIDGKVSIRRAIRLIEPLIDAIKAGKEPRMPKQAEAPQDAKPTAKPVKAKAETAVKATAKPTAKKTPAKPTAKPVKATAPKSDTPADTIDYDAIYARFKAGETLKSMAEELNINPGTLNGRMLRKGYQFPKRGA